MLYQLSYSRKSKDEGGRMKDERETFGARAGLSSFRLYPSYLLLVQGVGFEPT
jgi:hypothetical protein